MGLHFFNKTPEREFDPEYCQEYLFSYLNRLGLCYKLEKYGDKFPIYKAFIVDELNKRKYIGGGKGYKTQGIVSALAECSQHYLSYNTVSNYQSNKIQILSSTELLNFVPIESFAKLSKLFNFDEKKVFSTLIYQDIFDPKNLFYYPLCLTEIRYNKLNNVEGDNSLSWRSHDTGSSLGMSYNEALLHGINEWIEKHSYSIFLLEHFFSKNNKVLFLQKESLPLYISELVNYIEKTFSDNLLIIVLKNDFGIPCILTLFSNQLDCTLQPKGLGCSLVKEYAIEKSIFEALQCRLLRNSNSVKKEITSLQNFSKYPLFLKAYKLDFSQINSYFINYDDLFSYDCSNLSEQISYIYKLLYNQGGYKVYRHVFLAESSGLTSLQVLIPGLNETFLVKEGKFIVEKLKRGKL